MNTSIAIRIMLSLLIIVMLFHFSIILKIVPYEITWGGRLNNDTEMYVFESISISINLLLIILLLIKGTYLMPFIPIKVVNVVLWIFVGLFVLNTVGNVFAETTFEKFMALLTAASSFLIFIILIKKRDNQN